MREGRSRLLDDGLQRRIGTERLAGLVESRVQRLNALSSVGAELAKVVVARGAGQHRRREGVVRRRAECLAAEEVREVAAVEVADEATAASRGIDDLKTMLENTLLSE